MRKKTYYILALLLFGVSIYFGITTRPQQTDLSGFGGFDLIGKVFLILVPLVPAVIFVVLALLQSKKQPEAIEAQPKKSAPLLSIVVGIAMVVGSLFFFDFNFYIFNILIKTPIVIGGVIIFINGLIDFRKKSRG